MYSVKSAINGDKDTIIMNSDYEMTHDTCL